MHQSQILCILFSVGECQTLPESEIILEDFQLVPTGANDAALRVRWGV